jgi:hypothetical protein
MTMVNEVLNAISEHSFATAVGALTAKFLSYAVTKIYTPIDKNAALACGAVAGAIHTLFFYRGIYFENFLIGGSNVQCNIFGLAALAFAPIKVCERYKLNISYKASVTLTVSTFVTLKLLEKVKPSLDRFTKGFPGP